MSTAQVDALFKDQENATILAKRVTSWLLTPAEVSVPQKSTLSVVSSPTISDVNINECRH